MYDSIKAKRTVTVTRFNLSRFCLPHANCLVLCLSVCLSLFAYSWHCAANLTLCVPYDSSTDTVFVVYFYIVEPFDDI